MIDKSNIKLIKEGQLGKIVANLLRDNYYFLCDEIDKGVTDYSGIKDKPSINSNILEGNKSGEQLGLQNKLVSGSNIATINGNDITKGGNIELIKRLTQSEYDSLPSKNANTLYCIVG